MATGFGYKVLGFGGGTATSEFVVATGGTESTDGDFKIHTFTGDGTFNVAIAGDGGPAPQPNNLASYMVVGGGGGTAPSQSGGGGGGAKFPSNPASAAGTANTGGGGGGGDSGTSASDGGTGGSGVVIIRYKFQ